MYDAYEVQNAIYRAKLEQRRKVIGWKIGLVSKAMQSASNIYIPDSGILLSFLKNVLSNPESKLESIFS